MEGTEETGCSPASARTRLTAATPTRDRVPASARTAACPSPRRWADSWRWSPCLGGRQSLQQWTALTDDAELSAAPAARTRCAHPRPGARAFLAQVPRRESRAAEAHATRPRPPGPGACSPKPRRVRHAAALTCARRARAQGSPGQAGPPVAHSPNPGAVCAPRAAEFSNASSVPFAASRQSARRWAVQRSRRNETPSLHLGG